MIAEIKGIAFPLKFVDGHLARASGPDKLGANLKHIVTTVLGERLMRPSLGIPDAVFHKQSDAFLIELEGDIQDAIATFENRVIIEHLRIVSDDHGKVTIAISFKARAMGHVPTTTVTFNV